MKLEELQDGMIVYEEPTLAPALIQELSVRLVIGDDEGRYYLVDPNDLPAQTRDGSALLRLRQIGPVLVEQLHPSEAEALASILMRNDVVRGEVQARLDALRGGKRWL